MVENSLFQYVLDDSKEAENLTDLTATLSSARTSDEISRPQESYLL